MQDEFGTDVELIEGSKGIFDVRVDGQMLFSKYEHDRFPEDDEVVALLRDAAG